MKSGKITNFFLNLSIKNDLPKLFFISLYVLILLINSLVFYSAELQHRKSYKLFINQQLSQLEAFGDYQNKSELDQLTGMLDNVLSESEFVKNIVIILLNQKGEVLWHSNKLIEKLVENKQVKSNGIIKEMKFLDMPEINFKPYDIYEEYSNTLKENEVISKFSSQKVLHFFAIPNGKSQIYVEVLREFKRIVPWKTILYLQLGSLFITSLITAVGYFILKLYLKPMELFSTSMERFINYNHPEVVTFHSENEIGQLAERYNTFIRKASKWQDGIFDDTEGKNQKIIQYLQQKLTLKSIHKSDQFELLLFPKKTEGDFRKFVTVEENSTSSNILFVHLDINNIESNIDKHIIQDKFHDIVQRSDNLDSMNHELHLDLLEHSEVGPGYVYLHIENGTMSWVRSGPFNLYLIDLDSNNSTLLTAGNEYIESDPPNLENLDLANQSILVVGNELLDYLNTDAEEFNNSVIKPAIIESTPGKKLLLSLLTTIHSSNGDALKTLPMISLIRLK